MKNNEKEKLQRPAALDRSDIKDVSGGNPYSDIFRQRPHVYKTENGTFRPHASNEEYGDLNEALNHCKNIVDRGIEGNYRYCDFVVKNETTNEITTFFDTPVSTKGKAFEYSC